MNFGSLKIGKSIKNLNNDYSLIYLLYRTKTECFNSYNKLPVFLVM